MQMKKVSAPAKFPLFVRLLSSGRELKGGNVETRPRSFAVDTVSFASVSITEKVTESSKLYLGRNSCLHFSPIFSVLMQPSVARRCGFIARLLAELD